MNNIIIKIRDFDLKQTLECGQCFRFKKLSKNHYIINAKDKVLEISQKDKELIFHNISEKEVYDTWYDYFDLANDYSKIKHEIILKNPEMRDIIEVGSGIRILNQDFFESLISFIISQNKQIPQIKQILANISRKYGDTLKEDTFTFPTIKTLGKLKEEDFRDLKTGFRAKYLVDACSKIKKGIVNEERLRLKTYDSAMQELCQIKGVGKKVSNCVLLFGLAKREAFPIDVWIKRILEEVYFKEEQNIKDLQDFAKERFGDLGGYAQQYLFYYAREIKK